MIITSICSFGSNRWKESVAYCMSLASVVVWPSSFRICLAMANMREKFLAVLVSVSIGAGITSLACLLKKEKL